MNSLDNNFLVRQSVTTCLAAEKCGLINTDRQINLHPKFFNLEHKSLSVYNKHVTAKVTLKHDCLLYVSSSTCMALLTAAEGVEARLRDGARVSLQNQSRLVSNKTSSPRPISHLVLRQHKRFWTNQIAFGLNSYKHHSQPVSTPIRTAASFSPSMKNINTASIVWCANNERELYFRKQPTLLHRTKCYG